MPETDATTMLLPATLRRDHEAPEGLTRGEAGEARVRAGRVSGSAMLSRSTLLLVRRVLHAYRDGWMLDERLRRAARMAAEDARQHGLPAEGMLVTLKRAWAELAEVRELDPTDARELLDRLVTFSIGAYYARGASPLAPGRSASGDRSAA